MDSRNTRENAQHRTFDETRKPMNWTHSDWINLATAIGTFAATAVALWLSGVGARRQKRDAEERARLVAASMTFRLGHARDIALQCAMNAIFSDLTTSKAASDAKAVLSIVDVITRQIYTPTTEELQSLIPLGNNCAHRIARAYDYIGQARQTAQSIGNERFKDTLTEAGRVRVLADWAGQLNAASDLLAVAIRECEAATDIGAPVPSGQELHGND
jgi:hypothetical protein